MDIEALSIRISWIGFFLTLVINSTVLHTAFHHSNNIFGSYKYLIMSFSLMGIIFATAEIFSKPMIFDVDSAFIILTFLKPARSWKSFILLAMFASMFAVTIHLLTIQFVYRYWAIFKIQNVKKYFGKLKCVFLWFTTCAFVFLCMSLMLYIARPDTVSDEFLQNRTKSNLSLNPELMTYYIAMIYLEGSFNYIESFPLLVVIIMVAAHYIIISYCGFQMFKNMNKKMISLSNHLQRINKQLFRTLIIQVCLPTLFIFTPMLSIYIIPFFNLDLFINAGPIACSLSFYPSIDGLICLYFIVDYRNALKADILYFLNCLTCRTKSAEPKSPKPPNEKY